MDMKKKLQDTYLPEQEGRKSKVVIALSGGLNSFVSAYLLKIQKYDLIAVTVSLKWEDFTSDSSEVVSCHLKPTELEHIRTFCHQLGIPHFLVKASEEFKEEVVESWMGARMTGTKSNPCWNCHELRLRVLHKKMKELDAQWLATGHMAKLLNQDAQGRVLVSSSNDEVNDQSPLLSRLPHEILEKLMLPLSDLQQKEVDKLGENFGLHSHPKNIKVHECFTPSAETEKYLQHHIPSKYLRSGELIGPEKVAVGEHKGIHHYQYGDPISFLGQRQNEINRLSKFSLKEKKVEYAKQEYFVRKSLFLNACNISDETPWHEPMKGFLKLMNGEFIECLIYPKNISCAVIELEEAHFILEGSIVSILKKKGKNSKVFLTGKVRYIPEVAVIEEGSEGVKVNYSSDF
jgi:tRNA-specific 2-thiouridylase